MKKGMLKTVLAMTVATVMGFSLISCGNKTSDNKLEQIKKNGKLVVGLSADYAPYEFHTNKDGKDEIVGFDVDIAKQIASDLGVKLELKDLPFDSLVTSIPENKIDLVISGMTPTEERKNAVDFSDIYLKAEQGLIIRKADADKYKTFASLEGKKVGAQTGSIQADLAKEKIKGADITLIQSINDLILQVKSSKVEGFVCELPVAQMIVKNNPELAVAQETVTDSVAGSAIAVKKNSPELVAEVNKTIKKIQDEKLLDKYMNDATDLAAKSGNAN